MRRSRRRVIKKTFQTGVLVVRAHLHTLSALGALILQTVSYRPSGSPTIPTGLSK